MQNVRLQASYFPALVFSVLIPAAYTAVALLNPPQVWWDAGVGFHVWRSMEQGAPLNSHWFPDAKNIAQNEAVFAAWFSPGQYLAPQLLSRVFGIPVGVSIAIVTGLALCFFLVGCVKLCERFDLSPTTALAAVLFLAAFRYSTAPFSIYAGGEILVQGALPWLVVFALDVPESPPGKAAVIALFVLLVGWFAKLSGLIIGVAALVAACLPILLERKRITPGMIGGVGGALVAAALLYVFWFERGDTPATTLIFPSNFQGAAFSFAAPWVSGVAAGDLMAWLFLNPGRRVFENSWPVTLLTIPLSLIAIAMLVFLKKTEGQWKLLRFALVFYLVLATSLAVTYLRGGVVSIDERHVRSAGILFFLCALGIVLNLSWRHPIRIASMAVACTFALYGLASWASRTMNATGYVDDYSRTTQTNIDAEAVDFLRAVYAREGERALFILPSMEIMLALPMGARAHAIQVEFLAEDAIRALRYDGVVDGGLYIVIQRRLAETPRGELLRAAFVRYSPSAWEYRDFGDTRIYFQHASPDPNS